MNKIVSAAVCFSVAFVVSASAQQPAPPPASAQAPAAKGNFTECRTLARQNKVAKEQRQTFMRDCMKEVVAECRTKAGKQKLTADERRAFMRDCSGRPPAKAKS
jgi:hypothetical protein